MLRRTTVLVVIVAALAAMSMTVTGCSQPKAAAAPSQTEAAKSPFQGSADETYYMVTFVSGVEYWVAAFEGFKDAARQLGVKAVYSGADKYDLNQQVTVFEQVIAKEPSGVSLSPIDDAGFVEPVKAAMDKKIPIVTFASDTSTKKIAFVTSDNVKEGQFAARTIGKALGGKGKVMVTRNTQSNHQIRTNVFVETIKKEFPDIQVVADVLTQQDTNKSYTAVQTVAQKHPDLGAVFCPEGPSGRGAAQAAVELGGKIKVLTCDMDAAILQMIQEGKMFGSIQPNAYTQGYLTMMFLYLAKHQMLDPLNGWKERGEWDLLLPYVDNGLDLISKDNAQYFYTDKWLEKRGSKAFEAWK
ncbi:MAG TPA: substrate-binding domain-containing protein [Spirochaetia bacterium]|nr:substrate-binding domain-containing protein [Spirochaetia bacterium]